MADYGAVLEIRGARAEDGSTLRQIDTETWSPGVTPAPPTDPDLPFFGERNDPADVLVATEDGAVVGFAMVHQPLPLPSHEHVLELDGLAVTPSRQGRGLGRRLVEAAQQEAVRRGARKLSLRVLSTNPAARRLYESCGFTVEGILRGEFLLEGDLVDDILMAWPVADTGS